MESKVLREEVAGKATKSYQYSPWGQKLTQIKHNSDATKEYSQFLYHPKGDVEAITKDDGKSTAPRSASVARPPDVPDVVSCAVRSNTSYTYDVILADAVFRRFESWCRSWLIRARAESLTR